MIGLCPFHDEKTPSFTVSPSKNIYKCFGCGKGGGPVQFIMEHDQMSFPEAIRFLARKYNIELEVHADINTDPSFQSNTALREAMGYILSMGFVFKAKPDAFASTSCADKVI